ncbi:lysine decarboxylation/transport transcriptional activator CadC [Moritella sp. Urea-trap-13]|uniref:lysine decarboxylation/transport transcriptional activator CadC n=1 Tax=Moritella sp. Urea-trap-13 TaxID=2058327 RepID=UPI000C343C18|nr:lysine decarboxylation/transport transcriptional activator CadC [Moritella sp. Urea-trap-13]PKH05895.1 transcriptional regulator CadC [Moritella sp. Urea-trap-13]
MNGLCFQISNWILIVEENKLYRQGREVTVEPRLVNLLSFIAQSPNEVFGREELIEHIWDGAIVSDQVVTQSIFELRKILKDGRVDCERFIATVPKRGYRLVADTIELTCDDARILIIESKNVDAIDDKKSIGIDIELDCEQAITVFPAGPLTRAVTHISKHAAAEEAKSNTKLTFLQRYKLQLFDGFLLSVLICIITLCTYVQTKPEITRSLDTQVIEFKYFASQNSDVTSEYLADGISQKLMNDVLTLSDYRVQLKKTDFTTGILPGKLVSVRIDKQQGQSYLDINYRNNASNRVIFSKQYLISGDEMYESLHKASSELMAALRINPTPKQLDYVMQDLPKDQDLLTKLIIANHYTNQVDPKSFKQGIDLFEDILAVNPNNGLVLAERYIAYNVLSSLLLSDEFVNEIKRSSADLLENDAYIGNKTLAAREYEALALQALLQGDELKANNLITLAGENRRSSIYYIIVGKLAELSGNLDSAGDAYTQAFYIDTSIETYQLSSNLAFHSNLETIAICMYRAMNPSSIKLI